MICTTDNNTLSVAEVDIKNMINGLKEFSTQQLFFLNNLHNLNGGQMSTFNCWIGFKSLRDNSIAIKVGNRMAKCSE